MMEAEDFKFKSRSPFKMACFFCISVLIIGSSSTIAILYASGYRFNLKNHYFYKVSVLHFVSDPPAKIFINGSDSGKVTQKAVYLEPGNYNITLSNNGYTSFVRNLILGSGELVESKDIVLFRQDPKFTALDQSKIDISKIINESLAKNSDLFIAYDHEIWYQNRLVARFNQNLRQVFLYNPSYIIYQTNNSIGVIRSDGSNNQILLEYSSTSDLNFSLSNRNRTLTISDLNKTFVGDIR